MFFKLWGTCSTNPLDAEWRLIYSFVYNTNNKRIWIHPFHSLKFGVGDTTNYSTACAFCLFFAYRSFFGRGYSFPYKFLLQFCSILQWTTHWCSNTFLHISLFHVLLTGFLRCTFISALLRCSLVSRGVACILLWTGILISIWKQCTTAKAELALFIYLLHSENN